jgi:FlaA1/EpsC-like NDP-sugar epimerase
LNGKKRVKDDEIAITVSGLRSGEKLFEELTYYKNLTGTIHPRINSTAETPMSVDQLKMLLDGAEAAIRDGDHQKLYQLITRVNNGVSDVAGSKDVFIRRHNVETDKIMPLPLSNKS